MSPEYLGARDSRVLSQSLSPGLSSGDGLSRGRDENLSFFSSNEANPTEDKSDVRGESISRAS